MDEIPDQMDRSHGPKSGSETNIKWEVKKLYNHSTNEYALWDEFDDPVEKAKFLQAEAHRSAIIQRFYKGKGGEQESLGWQTQTLEVQSPRLRKFLDDIFTDYPYWNSGPVPYTFVPPFRAIFHVWDKIVEGSSVNQKSYPIRAEVKLLQEALKPIIAPYSKELEQVKQTGAVLFNSLWLIFAPGTLVVTNEGGHLSVSKLRALTFNQATCQAQNCHNETCSGRRAHWHLELRNIDWNGSYCGFADITVKISEFSGSRSVTTLPAFPFGFLPNQPEVRKQLLDRGRKFADCRGFSIKDCTGNKYIQKQSILGTIEIVKPVSGRVIVDGYGYYKCQNKVAPKLLRYYEEGTFVATKEDEQRQTPAKKERKEELPPLTDMERILSVPRVRGFDLKTKEWCEFNIDDLREPDWNDTAYEKLVLPEGEKELVMAFADRARIRNQGFDDFVVNKGEGVIMLLCGPPGVGKTLTAEAVAEKSRAPLYVLSASDLGTSPSEVESALDEVLECCRLWDAILLLDEGDVFLEARSSGSMDRNGLVSIFLRRLEYYRGLMFMTTNRINAIDPAFRSRADIILPYPDLDASARREVWSNFLCRLAPEAFQISEEELTELSQKDLNGREIKNTIKAAQMLSDSDGLLTMKHLHIVLNIRKRCYDFERAELKGSATKKRRL